MVGGWGWDIFMTDLDSNFLLMLVPVGSLHNSFTFSCIFKARWLASKEKGQIIEDASPQSVADSSPQGAPWGLPVGRLDRT